MESVSLTSLSDEILRRLGGSWDDPPPLPDPHSQTSEPPELLAPLRRAAATFEESFCAPAGPVCWTDPRTALVLPQWRRILEGVRPLSAVLCVREPLAAARSLDRATGLGLPVGLALWERYTRRAVEGLAGLPAFVSVFADALGDPERWQADLAGWLTSLEVRLPAGAEGGRRRGAPAARLSDEIAGEMGDAGAGGSDGGAGDELRGAGPDPSIVLPSQQRLYDELAGLGGAQASFAYAPAFAESPWSANVLEQRRDQNRFWQASDWLAKELIAHLPDEVTHQLPRPAPYPPNATTDLPRYHRFLRDRGEQVTLPSAERAAGPWRRSRKSASRPAPPLFSVLVPTYRTPQPMIDCCVSSVLAQQFTDFELCICDDASGDPALLRRLAEYTDADSRIIFSKRTEQGGVSAATNEALAAATGRYVVFLDAHDALHPTALRRLAEAIHDRPDADVLYSDEDRIDKEGMRHGPTFKPDWSPDLLLSNPYLSHVLVVRRRLVDELGGLRPAYDGAELYDLMLRATERTDAVVHAPEVLYHSRTPAGLVAEEPAAFGGETDAGRRALEDTVGRRGFVALVEDHPTVPGSYHVRRLAHEPLVSAVIPFRDEPALTAACYYSFVEQPGYENFELLLVDNDSALPETQALLEELSADRRVRILEAPGPFDWAAINNGAAKEARGDVLLFMNNDVEARSAGWLGAMVGHAVRPEVGAVGARLLYPDGTVQHAGVAVGLGWGSTHLQQGLPADEPGYMSIAVVTRNCSAVTGACLMARRDLFEEVGGFDSNLPIAFNDIDFCLRLRERGCLVVYTPLAELVHHESKSIGHTEMVEAPFFRRRWRSVMLAGDPYYNPNLGRFDNSCRLPTEEDEGKWATFLSMLDESSTS